MAHRRRAGRRLQAELLEARLALSADTIVAGGANDAFRLLYPHAVESAAPSARSAIEAITTSARTDELLFAIAPQTMDVGASGGVGAALTESGSLIGLDALRNDVRFAGIDGTGFSVVVLDTGVDLAHPFFGPDIDGNGVADRIVFNADFLAGGPNAQDVNGHGTHVSSIAVSSDAAYPGMAPGANLIHLRVLNDVGVGTAAAIEAALQWVVANVTAYNIVSVNMSLSTATNFAAPNTRPDLGFFDELEAISAQNVIVASAAGNDNFQFQGVPGVSYPAADPNSLAVSASWDADVGGPQLWSMGAIDYTTGPDRIISFSQRHPSMTSTFAPGGAIVAAAIGGGVRVLSGTSMATPHVAGIAALMQQLAVQTTGARLSLGQFQELLDATGIPIFDGDDEDDNVSNSNQWYRRIDVLAMANAILSNGLSDVALADGLSVRDTAAPSGGVARIDYTLVNQGLTATGAFTTGVYLSIDDVIDESDILLDASVHDLAAGQFLVRSSIPVSLPAGLTPGTYFLGIVLDDGHVVSEGNETNNVATVEIHVTEPQPEIWLVDALTGAMIADGVGVINLGNVDKGGADGERTLRLHNDGSEPLELTDLIWPAGYDVIGFPSVVAPGDAVDFEIRLLASNPLGTYGGVVSFSSNDADENPFTFSLSGNVVEPDDHGNDAASATVVTMPDTVGGTIFPTGETDWFRIQAVRGVQHRFETILGTLSDSILTLFDSDGTSVLAADDDGGPGLASLITWTAPADGYYYLRVSRKGNASGSYQASFTLTDDYGNSSGDAAPITDPSSTPGAIESVNDVDWFSFVAMAGVEYRIEVAPGSLTGATIGLIDVDGSTPIVIVAADGPIIGSIITWTAPANGTYFIEAKAASSELIGTYELLLTGDDDHGDNALNATAVAVPSTTPGVIETPFDPDWFAVDVIGGARYRFSTELVTLADSVLRVIDTDGVTELAVDDNSGEGQSSLIDWIAPASGVYFVAVSGSDWRSGSYALNVELLDDHGDEAASATPISDPGLWNGVIALAGDVDWFSFQAFAGVEYHLQATPGLLDAVAMRLLGPDGAAELASITGQSAQPASILWTAPADGVYFVEVAAAHIDGVGGYELLLSGDDDHGDGAANATVLAIPHPVDGEIERPRDADWFRLETLVGLDYRVEVGLGTLPEARVRLLAADGTTVVGEATSGGEPLVALQWTASGKLYFIEVTSLASSFAASAAAPASSVGDYQVTPSLLSPLPGDFDGDDDVDGADLLVWQRLVGRTSNGLPSPLDSGGFEDYEVEDGETLLLEDAGFGWVKLGPPRGSATIDATNPDNQVVRVERGVNADSRWAVPLGPIAPMNNVMLVMWDMMVLQNDERLGALGPFFGVEAYDDAGTFGLLGSFGVDATSLDLIYQAQDTGYFTETGAKAAAGVWHSFAISLDYARHEYTVYFDGQPLATTGFVDRGPLHTALDQLTDADIAALASQGNAVSRNATGTAYFDNFKIVNGVSGEYLRADGNRDGVVDGLDLQLWKDHYGLDYSGRGTPAVAAAGVAATPQAPAGFFAAASTPRFEASRLEVSLAEETPGVVEASSEFGATHRDPLGDFTWLAYGGRGVDEPALPSRGILRAGVQEAQGLLSPADRDAALAQLSGDDAEVDFGDSGHDDDEAESDVDAEFFAASCSALDALFAEL